MEYRFVLAVAKVKKKKAHFPTFLSSDGIAAGVRYFILNSFISVNWKTKWIKAFDFSYLKHRLQLRNIIQFFLNNIP